jgi:2-dehydro-3-deoxygluconokinase
MATTAHPEVLCIGETMAMLTSADSTPLATAQGFTVTSGGAESNLAHYLAENGLRTAWISALGADPMGDRILASLGSAGVDTRWVGRRRDANTALYVKDPRPGGSTVYYYRKGSAASLMAPQDIAGWPLATARWVHMTGITPALSPSCRALVPAVIEAAHAAGAGVSFDINHRPAIWGPTEAAEVLRPLADSADVVLLGLDEGERLWGTRTSEEAAEVFPNAGRVVVKDGGNEAVEVDRTSGDVVVTRVPAQRVPIVEPVGAGDAFGAGYLTASLRGDDATARLALGHSLAAWVLASPLDVRLGHGPAVRTPEPTP